MYVVPRKEVFCSGDFPGLCVLYVHVSKYSIIFCCGLWELLLCLDHLLARVVGYEFKHEKEVVVNSYVFCKSFLRLYFDLLYCIFSLLWIYGCWFLFCSDLFFHLTCYSCWVFLLPSFGHDSSFQKDVSLLPITPGTLQFSSAVFLFHFLKSFFDRWCIFALGSSMVSLFTIQPGRV